MPKRIFSMSLTIQSILFATCSFTIILVSTVSFAGKLNPETGETCVGLDCTDLGDVDIPDTPDTGLIRVSTVETYDCSDLETNKIHFAVDWLKTNLSGLDERMGSNGLMAWPGNSRNKFADKLEKELKFYCISGKDKCDDLLGIVYPVLAQKRINLCTNSIRDDADGRDILRKASYVHVIAHETGHLIRFNEHRNNCIDLYSNPRFSQSVGLAAEYAYRGLTYNAADFSCASTQTDWEDIVDNKLKESPVEVKK